MSYRNKGVSSHPDAGASMPAPWQDAYCLAQRTRHLHPQINEEAFFLSLVFARAFIQWGGCKEELPEAGLMENSTMSFHQGLIQHKPAITGTTGPGMLVLESAPRR